MASELAKGLAKAVIDTAAGKGVVIATAESCTGGLISGALTDIPGSSAAVDRAFITYSNNAKIDMLGIPEALIDRHGAVSGAVAKAMATGALSNSGADLVVSVTGIAGPGGGTDTKPVGLVWFGLARKDAPIHAEHHIFDDRGRDYIRSQTVETALRMLLGAL